MNDTNETAYIGLNGLYEAFASYNTMVTNRLLAHAIGRDEALIYQTLLSKRNYYQQKDLLDSEGYFYSTVADLQESTTLSKFQQASATKKLEEIGLIKAKLKGIPAKKYFCILENNELLLSLLNIGLEKSNSYRKKVSESGLNSQKSRNLTSCDEETELQEEKHKKSLESSLNSQKSRNLTSCSEETEQQVVKKLDNRQSRNLTSCGEETERKTILNKTNIINYNNQSIYQSDNDDEDMIDGLTEEDYRNLIKEHIDYDFLILPERKFGKENVDEIVEIMTETIVYNKNPVKIQGNLIPAEMVKNRFLNLNSEHIEYVMEKYNENFDGINNVKSYLITMLYNSYSTIKHHYQQMVLHDMYGGG